MKHAFDSIKNWLAQYPVVYDNLKYAGVILLAYLSFWITKKIFFRIIQNLTKKTHSSIDDLIFNNKLIRYLSLIAPLYIIQKFAYLGDDLQKIIELITTVLIALNVLLSIGNLITSITEYYSRKEKFSKQPIKGYAQIIKISIYIFGSLFIIGVFTGEKPWVILTGLGALSAVILLIFKDTILSFVASIQISSYELLKIGDWIEMPLFDADGTVVDIALHTIKVQNWDMTYTLIPTYKLVENSFKNWKGMEQSGSRRIKRNVSIDMKTIRFIDDDFLKQVLSSQYLENPIKEILTEKIQKSQGQRTNLGLFIEYLTAYLKSQSDIRKDLVSVVRTLQSTSEGLPLEVYAFCSKTNLLDYENVQKEIFEHIFAVITIFGLNIYQRPN